MHIKKTTLTRTTTAFALGLACLVGTTTAAGAESSDAQVVPASDIIVDAGGSERINYSGKLRMLSQRIPAAACNIQAAVDPFKSSDVLSGAIAEFDKILAGLEHGDTSLGMGGAETRRKTLAAIEDVKARWAPYQDAANAILQDASNADAGQAVATGSMPLLGTAKLLVSEISGQYSNPAALVQADAIRIDIAGRQRMLTQKISKEACHILSGIDAETAKGSLSGTIQMFEVSLQALRFGMPEAGIKASDNPAINDGLTLVASNWADIRAHLTAVEAGETLDRTKRAELFHGLNTTMANMNKVVGIYSDTSKLGL